MYFEHYFRVKGGSSCFEYRGQWCRGGGGGGGGGRDPSNTHKLFCIAKRKKEETFSKQKLLKGCHQGQNVTHFANLEHLEFKKFKTCFIILFHYFVCLLENGSWWCIGDVPKICSEVQYLLQSIHWRWGQ